MDSFSANFTAGTQYQGLIEGIFMLTLVEMPLCVFFVINAAMLYTLRSKPVFRETSRYILLYNLLFSDTAHLVISQILYLLSACRLYLTYSLCSVLVMFSILLNEVSPSTLAVMSLERYIAVCHPLRHAAIANSRNTGMACVAVWALSLLNVIVRVLLLLEFLLEELGSLQMTEYCSNGALLIGSVSGSYNQAYTSFLFLSSGVVIISSYIGVILAARSASTHKVLAHKARKTLLLHMVQLGLSLSSAMYSNVIEFITGIVQRLTLVRIKIILYLFIFLFPRYLNSLIYGLKDQTIRPVLIYHLCCGLNLNNQNPS